jgi:hypothetical protein
VDAVPSESRGKKGPNPCVAYTATATRASDSGSEQVGLMPGPFLHVGARKGGFISVKKDLNRGCEGPARETSARILYE